MSKSRFSPVSGSRNRLVLAAQVMAAVSAATTVGAMFLLLGDVILRGFFHMGIPGVLEFGQFFMILIVFFGLAYVQTLGRHMKIVVLLQRLPVKVQWYVNLVVTIILALTGAIVTYRTGIYAWDSWWTHDVAWVAGLNIPLWPIRGIVPLGMGVLTIQLLMELVSALSGQSDKGGD